MTNPVDSDDTDADAIDAVRSLIVQGDAACRKQILDELFGDVCLGCYRLFHPDRPCHCQNDE